MKTQLFTVDKNVDVVYSPDDNGWYLQKYLHNAAGTTKVSHAVFATKRKALEQYSVGNIVWE